MPFHELLPVREKGMSEKASLHDNLIVHGDNLAALKALLPTYHGKVKCIYIDPPYNTGKEGWAYNDKVNSPLMQDWLGRVVDRDDLTRHDKWCCMMLPRLKLLRQLLREDGVIFVSIDDNEVHHLRCLMDEVFGEHNRVGKIIWHGSTDNNPTNIATEHEYIVCYAANKQELEEVWKVASFGPKAALQRIEADILDAYQDSDERQQEYSCWLKEHRVQVKPLDDYKFVDEAGVFAGSRSVHNPGREGYRYDVQPSDRQAMSAAPDGLPLSAVHHGAIAGGRSSDIWNRRIENRRTQGVCQRLQGQARQCHPRHWLTTGGERD